MSQPENDLISFDDLFAALGPSSPTPKSNRSQSKKSPSKKKPDSGEGDISDLFKPSKASSAEVDSIDSLMELLGSPSSSKKEEPEEEIDLISALGFSKPGRRSTVARMTEKERRERDTEREAQIREQQIRSQQWKRELAQQEERKRQKAMRDAEESQKWQPTQAAEGFEAAVSTGDQASQAGTGVGTSEPAVEAAEKATEQRISPFAQEEKEIAQPAFLDKMAEPKEIAVENVVAQQVQGTQQAHEGSIRGRYSDLPVYNAGQVQAQQAQAQVQTQAQSQAQAQAQSQVQTQSAADASASTLQASQAQTVQPASTGRIQPLSARVEESVAESADKQEAVAVSDSQPTQRIAPLDTAKSSGDSVEALRDQAAFEGASKAEEATPSNLDQAQELAADSTEGVSHVAVPPKPSLIKPLDISKGSTAKAADSEEAASVSVVQEAPFVAPAQGAKEINIEQHTSSSKGNIVGIILIVFAIICAILTVLLFTGVINYSTFSGGGTGSAVSSQASSSSSASSSASASVSSGGATEAVYKYVVRGTDGGTYEATETAQFGDDGLLEQSSIDIKVTDPEIAKALMDQLKDEFGSSVQNATTNENGVSIVVKVSRDDLDLNSYTELLSNSMAEFEVVEM